MRNINSLEITRKLKRTVFCVVLHLSQVEMIALTLQQLCLPHILEWSGAGHRVCRRTLLEVGRWGWLALRKRGEERIVACARKSPWIEKEHTFYCLWNVRGKGKCCFEEDSFRVCYVNHFATLLKQSYIEGLHSFSRPVELNTFFSSECHTATSCAC